jgi:hypothetical protein
MRYLLTALLILIVSPVAATTYDYVGQPFTSFAGLCNASNCTIVTGTVTFDFDTSNFSGQLFLSDSDVASLTLGLGSRSYRIPSFRPNHRFSLVHIMVQCASRHLKWPPDI